MGKAPMTLAELGPEPIAGAKPYQPRTNMSKKAPSKWCSLTIKTSLPLNDGNNYILVNNVIKKAKEAMNEVMRALKLPSGMYYHNYLPRNIDRSDRPAFVQKVVEWYEKNPESLALRVTYLDTLQIVLVIPDSAQIYANPDYEQQMVAYKRAQDEADSGKLKYERDLRAWQVKKEAQRVWREKRRIILARETLREAGEL